MLRPAAPPDELFHQAISGLLLEWAEARRNFPFTVQVVGETWSGRAYQLRETLGRCAIPHSFLLANSGAGRALVNAAGPQASLPLVVFPNGQMLQNPSNADLASAAGWTVTPERMNFDLVIVGSGPAGLSAAVYGASEGFSTLVIDEGGIGGQSTSSSLIRNYLGFPRGISGRSLAQRAYEQAWLFGVQFAFMQEVTELREEDGGAALHLADFGWVGARAVLLATGATYRRLGVAALEDLSGAGVFYGGPVSEASGLAGQEVYVLGGANSAGQAALHLARYARRVTIVVRAGSLEAGMSHYLVRQIEATPNVEVRVHTEVVDGGGDGRLERLVLRDHDGEPGDRSCRRALHPHRSDAARRLAPRSVQRDHRGFVLTGTDLGSADGSDDDWPLERRPLLLETSMPRVFAAGDIRHGSAKRVASAVGEGSVAVQLLHQLFADDRMHPRGRPTAPPVAPDGDPQAACSPARLVGCRAG